LHARLTHLQSSAEQDSKTYFAVAKSEKTQVRTNPNFLVDFSGTCFSRHDFQALSLSWEDDVSVVSVDL
jgi:hypothetical protein